MDRISRQVANLPPKGFGSLNAASESMAGLCAGSVLDAAFFTRHREIHRHHGAVPAFGPIWYGMKEEHAICGLQATLVMR
ncbi:MAG: hypothetical protein RQ752_00690 [Thermohalobaculum sp.]|nr:hypothetical protein [Thermohalobaculum sp.]